MSDTNAIRTFLHSLWDGKPDEAFVLVWKLQGKRSAWFQSLDRATEYIAATGMADVYTGVGLARRDYGPANRCPSEEVAGIAGLWADLDLASRAHADKPLPKTQAEALALVPDWLQPTYTVGTGNGLHIWLLFKEPWIFDNEDERLAAANLELRFQTLIAQHAAAHGWSFDRLADLARILRVPGTLNLKNPADPKAIEIVSNSGPRWNPSELIDLFDELQVVDPALEEIRKSTKFDFVIEPGAVTPPHVLGALIEADRSFKSTWEQKRRNLKDSSPSGYDLALTNIGVVAGLSDQAIVNLLIEWRRRHGHPPKLRFDYLARTIHLVRSTLSMPAPEAAASAYADAAAASAAGADTRSAMGAAAASGAGPYEAPPRTPPPPSDPPKPGRGPERPKDDSKLLELVRNALRLPVRRILKVRGEDPSYVIDLDDGRSVEMSSEAFFNQHRFAHAVFVALDVATPRFKEAQWRSVLGSIGQMVEVVDRDVELTAEGTIRKFLLSYLAQVPFQLEQVSPIAGQKMYPIIREKRIAVSATHLRTYVKQAFREDYEVKALTAMLVKIGSKHWRERIGRTTEQSRWLLPADQFAPEDYVHMPEDGQ